MKSDERRRYTMSARAESTAQTAERIMDAAAALFYEKPSDDIALDQVAARAGVTVQTVLRRFGSKSGLFAAAGERESRRIRAERAPAQPGNADAALHSLVDHYERVGDGVLRMLAEAERNPAVRDIVESGRAYHVRWCRRAFPSAAGGLQGVGRRRRWAQIVAVTDVLTWKLLRRDSGLSRAQTELAMRELLTPLLGGT